MTNKRILIFYPHNFYELSSGTHRRVYDLLTYLKSRDFSMDLLTIDGFTNRWGKEDLERRDFFDSIEVRQWRPSLADRWENWRRSRRGRLHSYAFPALRRAFRNMAAARKYDFVLVNYAYWADLTDGVSKTIPRVIDLHDFMTLNRYLAAGQGEFRFGAMFEDEIRAISKFDFALSISEEETLSLSPFCPGTRFVRAPVSFSPRFVKDAEYLYDLLFVGSDNEFNREGMSWFMKSVYPRLPSGARIAVVGGVCRFLEERQNVVLIPHAEDLGDLYGRSKLVFCPVQGGSGLKVKVVEALSYGRPVITTPQGLSGIVQKQDNGCFLAEGGEEFARGILLLLNNDGQYERYREKAEAFFLKNFSMEVCHEGLDRVFMRSSG